MDSRNKTHLNWFVSAGIVGADIGTSVFYSTGVLFPIVGYLAPLFVLATCLAMWIFKKTYEEGLAMSPRNGGAYSMILRTLGRRVACSGGGFDFCLLFGYGGSQLFVRKLLYMFSFWLSCFLNGGCFNFLYSYFVFWFFKYKGNQRARPEL